MSLFDRLFSRGKSFRLVDARAEVRSWAPPETAPERCFLHIRSVRRTGGGHVMQFAAADDAANVLISVFVSTGEEPGLADATAAAPPRPLPWDRLEAALEPLSGAAVVVFGRRTQGGLLPPGALRAVARLDDARERFEDVMRRKRIRIPPGELSDGNDARRLVGLAPVRSPDAALRALGLRELWRWMDAEGSRGRYASDSRPWRTRSSPAASSPRE